MPDASLHLIKLCVGADGVQDLIDWQARTAERNAAAGRPALPSHVTRMWPRRADEIAGTGSLYWVFRGVVRARQSIRGFEPREGADGIRRCAILLDAHVVRTAPQPRRAFQGWRYLRPQDAPRDLAGTADEADLPPRLAAELADLGVL